MNKETALIRNKLKQIVSITDFDTLLNNSMLSDEEKEILILHYKQKYTMSFIADMMGMSEIAVKKKHSKILMKIGKMIN